uniref:Nucleotidyl transferase AbiEii/AbiGii toxin family protein n=1 Tax=Lactobacillus johnsonii TaxID=33959 RepID=A0A9W3SN83_LACJH|nr:hypothetical protein BBP16_10000 [Lactobacillus johnsonii]
MLICVKLAKESKTTTEVILEEYTLDDFVQRIAKSKYRNNLILKGGFLLSSLMGINNRTTEDIDTDIKGKDLSLPEVTKMVMKFVKLFQLKMILTIERAKLKNCMKEQDMLDIEFIYLVLYTTNPGPILR